MIRLVAGLEHGRVYANVGGVTISDPNCYITVGVYIYIYAFSRRFYPKQLTLHSSYSLFVFFTFDQLLLSLGIEPMILVLLAQCPTIWATGKPKGVMFWFAYFSVVFFIHKIYIRRRKQWCLRLTVCPCTFPCTELLLLNYSKVNTVFHSMAPLK